MALNPNISILKLGNQQQYVSILQHCHDIASQMYKHFKQVSKVWTKTCMADVGNPSDRSCMLKNNNGQDILLSAKGGWQNPKQNKHYWEQTRSLLGVKGPRSKRHQVKARQDGAERSCPFSHQGALEPEYLNCRDVGLAAKATEDRRQQRLLVCARTASWGHKLED